MKGGSAHVGSSRWHRRDRSQIGAVIAAVRISAVVVAAVPLQSGDAAVIPAHHTASFVLSFDRGTILFSPARRGTRECIDCSMCWNMSIGNRCVLGLFGNGCLVLAGGLFGAPDLGKDGHGSESDRQSSAN